MAEVGALSRLRHLAQAGRLERERTTAEQYRRAALGEIILPEPISPDERGIWPISIPHKVMCARLLEWNL